MFGDVPAGEITLQVDVGHKHVGGRFGTACEGLFGGLGFEHLETFVGQRRDRHFSQQGIVFDDEDF